MSDTASPKRRLSEAQRYDWLRLARCDQVGPRTFVALVNRFGGAGAALAALPDLIARGTTRAGLKVATTADIDREIEAADRMGVRFVARGEPDYPPLLDTIDSAPPILAIRGDPAVFARPAVAIVGARNASAGGLVLAERLARGVAEGGYVVVSGLARGIDARAHTAVLETGTIAVLPGGHDRPYPPEHAGLLDRLVERGAALSEMPFGWEPRGRDFPRRNRLVSGLALGTVVVEAARRSGSLITARFALEQGRDVFAVPGSPLDPRAEGPNDLLRDGAILCAGAEDILRSVTRRPPPQGELVFESHAAADEPLWDELDLADVAPVRAPPRGMAEPDPPAAPPPAPLTGASGRDRAAERIVALLGPAPVSIDDLSRAAQLPPADLRGLLVELELAGRLARHGGDLISLPQSA
jgi:DNA processing protein